jgi:hypothetical protein
VVKRSTSLILREALDGFAIVVRGVGHVAPNARDLTLQRGKVAAHVRQ